jgi:hypothetical protein
MPKTTSAWSIQNAEAFCKKSISTKGGIILDFPSKGDAINFRMKIYTARRASRNPKSPLNLIEMKLYEENGTWSIKIAYQGFEFTTLKARDALTGEPVEITLDDIEERIEEIEEEETAAEAQKFDYIQELIKELRAGGKVPESELWDKAEAAYEAGAIPRSRMEVVKIEE